MNRKKVIIGAVVALLFLGVGGYFGGRFAIIKYHRYQLTAYYSAASKAGPADPGYKVLMGQYSRHATVLMEMGYFTKRQFYLQKISARSVAYSELQRKLWQRFPTSIGKIEPHGYIYGEPTFLVIWLHADDMKTVEQFVAQHDV